MYFRNRVNLCDLTFGVTMHQPRPPKDWIGTNESIVLVSDISNTALNLFLTWPFLFFSVTYMPFITIFGHPTYFFFLHSF